jgi:NADP-dependent 3-hydroxy acid dehydrogenase YdfG
VATSKIIVITGATSGIGAAVANVFWRRGSRVFLVGRNARKLGATARKIPSRYLAGCALADLTSVAEIKNLIKTISGQLPRVDMLVHAAGEYGWTESGSLKTDGLDAMFAVNVRAPYLLTQGLLQSLQRASGLTIFINSSIVKNPGEGIAAYKATKHAIQGLADSLRQDLNRHGVRVTSLYPGQTATPNLRRIYAKRGKPYQPRKLMSAMDVGRIIVALTELPAGVEITDIHLRSPVPY